MSSNTVEGFLLQFDFDGKRALAGIHKINNALLLMEKNLKSIGKEKLQVKVSGKTPRMAKGETQQAVKQTGEAKKQTAEEKKQLEYMAKQEALAHRMNRLRNREKAFAGRGAFLDLKDRNPKAAEGLRDKYRSALAAGDPEELGKVNRQLRDMTRNYKDLDRHQKKVAISAKNVVSVLKGVAVASGLMAIGAELGARAVGNAAMEVQAVQNSLLITAGNATKAGKEFEYVSKMALKLGSDLTSASKGYQQIAVATKGMMSEAQTKELFEGTLEISTALGLSADDTFGSLRALVQMASKGKITAEELKSQLGERLPGAVQIFGNSLGLAVDEMFYLMERGELIASETLPFLAKELSKVARTGGALQAQMKSLRAEQNRLRTTTMLFLSDIGTQGVSEKMTERLKILNEFLNPSNQSSDETRKGLATIFNGWLKFTTWLLEVGLPAIESFFGWFNKTHAGLSKRFGEDTADMIMWLGALTIALGVAFGAMKLFRRIIFGGKMGNINKSLRMLTAGAEVGSKGGILAAIKATIWSVGKYIGKAIAGLSKGLAASIAKTKVFTSLTAALTAMLPLLSAIGSALGLGGLAAGGVYAIHKSLEKGGAVDKVDAMRAASSMDGSMVSTWMSGILNPIATMGQAFSLPYSLYDGGGAMERRGRAAQAEVTIRLKGEGIENIIEASVSRQADAAFGGPS